MSSQCSDTGMTPFFFLDPSSQGTGMTPFFFLDPSSLGTAVIKEPVSATQMTKKVNKIS
ncbi:hypothetical protein [Wolbachia endosymbiont (group A) of Agelastica alni]|uniref:hypothetical protein n=1 Tax=Wolbachia endosymbiont (group A) of Agelastica alni TaxID=3066130 RepID=UPI003132E22D